MDPLISYTGAFLKHRNEQLNIDAYNPSPALQEAVNLALLLKQPLLLMGEPGCGKTRLAEAVAVELHQEKWSNHYFRWNIKSTSKAKEGIYFYDALKRLYDVNSNQSKPITDYITYGPLARALTTPQNGHLPNILLIDEIDKADIDFPNDLLLEIEKREFHIPELQKDFQATSEVLIFITSNRERELPAAFLRRCLFHYINFPTPAQLAEIIDAKFRTGTADAFVDNAIKMFMDVRSKIESQFAENEKKPATSELLEWFKVLNTYRLHEKSGNATEAQQQLLQTVSGYQSADKLSLPFPQVLLKTWESRQLFETTS